MEQGLLVAISLLPLGLVAVVAYLMVTRKKKQAPKLELVKSEPVAEQKPKKARKKRKPARGKRK